MIEYEEDGVAMEPGSRGRCEVAVQWERPEGQCRDVGVQVDLIGLSFVHTGSDVPWRCVSVRAEEEEPGGGALWRCCLHSPLTPSDALLRPEKTPTKTPETTLPSMQHASPSVGLPSMPICGDSPSSSSSKALERPDPPRLNTVDAMDAKNAATVDAATDAAPEATDAAPEATDAAPEAPEAALEALGFMAPLSSDEEGAALPGHDEPPIKRRRGRPKTSARIFSSPESRARRRSINARRAGLPLRYQLDYDLASHDRAAGEFAEFHNIASPKQEEADLQIDPSARALDGAIKEEPMDEDALASARRDWPKAKKIKPEKDKTASKKAPDWSKHRRFVMKRDGDCAASGKDVKKQRAKRGPGRPRKSVPVKQEEFKIEVDFTSETESAERSYQLESEDPDPRGGGFHEDLEPGEVPDWFGQVKMEELETEWANEMDESLEGGSEVSGKGRIKLGDVLGSGVDGERGLVKKVKILSSDKGEQCENGYDDVQSLFVLRGGGDRFREGPDAGRGRRKRRRREESRVETQADPKRRAGFLVYRDEATGRAEFISPCYVKLQPLQDEQEMEHVHH